MTQEQMKLLKQIIVGEIKTALSAHNRWAHNTGPTGSEPSDWSNYVAQEFVEIGFDSHDPKNGLKNHRPIKLGAMQKELWDSLCRQFPVSEQEATKEQEVSSKDSKEVDVKKELSTLDRNDFGQVCNLVDRIFEDITEVLKVAASSNIISQSDALEGVLKDYMIDLINPDLLDFNSKKGSQI
jgi:hypothetical protein